MKDGTASHTARSVAARRLQYPRPAAGYGDPAADDALSRDVAGGLTPQHNRMHEYIRARTAFFDRVLLDVLGRGVTQVVIGGAGYDGRALRYAAPGVRWFELDHPATQSDKRARLTRLGIGAAQVSFIPADFTADPVAEPLLAAGLDPARPSLFLFEGVAVYLEQAVTERVLAEFAAVAAPGSLLAISVSVGSATSPARARFQQRVAELGEPVRTVLTAEAAAGLLAAAGWALAEVSGRQLTAGLLLARVASPAGTERVRLTQQRPAGSVPAASPPAVSPPAASPATAAPGKAALPHPVTAQQAAALPLSALLSQVLVAFTIEADNEAEHRVQHRTTRDGAPGAPGPWLTSMLMWANCLRQLPDAGITVAELRDRARTGTNLDGMRRWRYVTFTPAPRRGKRPAPDAVIAPTPLGSAARDAWQLVVADVEARWRSRLGPAAFDPLLDALAAVAAGLDPELADCLPILGYGLRARSGEAGESSARASESEARQAGREGVVGLPLWGLLARLLRAFALQYEREPGPSLAISADVLRVLAEPGVLVKDIPALGGVSKESVAMALGWLGQAGLVTVGADPSGGRFRHARLTRRGVLARDEYPALAADIERDWRARFGDDAITALRRALEPLAAGDPPPLFAALRPYPDNWRAAARPAAVLPHFPMTLHRGGFPDGS